MRLRPTDLSRPPRCRRPNRWTSLISCCMRPGFNHTRIRRANGDFPYGYPRSHSAARDRSGPVAAAAVEVNARAPDGATPLALARRNGRTKMVALLLQDGVTR